MHAVMHSRNNPTSALSCENSSDFSENLKKLKRNLVDLEPSTQFQAGRQESFHDTNHGQGEARCSYLFLNKADFSTILWCNLPRDLPGNRAPHIHIDLLERRVHIRRPIEFEKGKAVITVWI
jgi:hypothetical protein